MHDIEKPIFIHSWFRSGSTYIWTKFRSVKGLYCYYEPLHEKIARLDDRAFENSPSVDMFKKLRHPSQENDYFFEYKNIEKLDFKSKISYDKYLLNEFDDELDLKQHLNCLIDHANSKKSRAVLSFCRSQLRVNWMRHNFDAIHIASIRNPLDQWKSFNIDRYFIDKIFRITHSLHRAIPELFRPIRKLYDFLILIDDKVPSQIKSYPIQSFSHEDVFSAFLIIWVMSTWQSFGVSDYTIDIDDMSVNKKSQTRLSTYLNSLGLEISFDDCNIPRDNLLNSNQEKLESFLLAIVSEWSKRTKDMIINQEHSNNEKLNWDSLCDFNKRLLKIAAV